ncbi:alpha-ketoglutarate-dependent dioxygenase AlkB [Nocardioides sp. JQ2195]|uniref:alpha-ketoglutarate-dependent dioxygenase AlkB n=1 Tax=Nocardioides sp. JQ2195 TaxID=2592334 RepID=UPI00143EE29F|nr:alpha-ketoglutarate-dependent dioxygenase AlkB [Nocardioides sp. JQ2195]QIX25724.1 alpha-ketoglutarate-dependent dioxygenase AlkB [Nocardioides sp. JQ2195]
MSVEFQANLFDVAPAPEVGSLAPTRRTPLATPGGRAAWVDVRPNWITGADEVFARLVADVPWRAERREMWDQVVDVPRLLHTYAAGEALPHPTLVEAREALSNHYLPELEEPFVSAGCCYYRDGRDSVAWHGDTIGRGRHEDTMVAIVSFGDPRRLALRPRREAAAGRKPTRDRETATERQGRHTSSPRGGGESISFTMGHGDLLVMGGSCQRTWEHCVPKTARSGPRISVQFRPLNVF